MGPGPTGRFPPEQRVRKRSEYQRAQTKARRVSTAHFVILLHRRDAESTMPARLGVVVSRRVGNAVVRNRAKRLVREAFRTTRDLFASGLDVVVVVRRPLAELKLGDVVAEWREAARAIARRTEEALGESGAPALRTQK